MTAPRSEVNNAERMISSLSNPTPSPSQSPVSRAVRPQSREPRVCRYFSKSGSCRAGNDCPFVHDATRLPARAVPITTTPSGEAVDASATPPDEDGMVQDRRQAMTKPVPASRVVAKPVPVAQTQSPRQFQLGQIRRRFSPSEQTLHGPEEGTTQLKFNLIPSDPDFPFEMSSLKCQLHVPASYPESKPWLKVGNNDIPRGFSLNVESGFDGLAMEYPDSTLLELMKALDRNLEAFLSAPKADTVKLVLNKDTRHISALPSRSLEPTVSAVKTQSESSTSGSKAEAAPMAKPAPIFTLEQKTQASQRRQAETRQLEARLGRLPLFKKSGDGIAYTVPVEPRRQADLPVTLHAVKSAKLFVPLLYPLEPCRISLDGVDPIESKLVETGFAQKAKEQAEVTLMGHLNYLAQNMHHLAKTILVPEVGSTRLDSPKVAEAALAGKEKEVEMQEDPKRSHIHYIPRPLEWTIVDPDDAFISDSDVDSYDTDETSEEEGGAEVLREEPAAQPEQPGPERGTAISFPLIELYGVEILEVVTLNLTVKCERCKEATEIRGLRNGVAKQESCKKCASAFRITYRRHLVHANAVRAGFLDLEGCIAADMLPSSFIPTCSECSTPYPSPGIISVCGETTRNVCRECHQKFTFSIPQIKFLRISSLDRLPPSSGPRRKKETLGLTPGTELPKRGRCRHYSKSFRWFRFSCCQKVYACDKCHDSTEEHPHEWANRMICGWCSRETNYRPEDCGICHHALVGKTGGGFWEGGKGTRDRIKMSRKDKRKFRRPGGSAKAT